MQTIKILSLRTDLSRRSLIGQQLDKFKLPYEFVDAPDGRVNMIMRNIQSDLSNTEAACALGHINIYTSLLNSDRDYEIIIEDDVLVNDSNIHLLEILIKLININLPAIYILGGQDGINASRYFVGKKVISESGLDLIQSFRSSRYLFRTCCYIITKEAARNIINVNNGLILAADNWGQFVKKRCIIEPFIIRPAFFTHPKDLRGSYIQQSRSRRQTLIERMLRPILISVRVISYIFRLISCRLS